MREPDKRRPGVILTRSQAVEFLNSITVAPVTSSVRMSPSFVALRIEDGLFEECAVNLDGVQTVERTRIGEYITHLPPERMAAVRDATIFALGLG